MESSTNIHTAFVLAKLTDRERILDGERRSASAQANGSTSSEFMSRRILARLGGRLRWKEDDS